MGKAIAIVIWISILLSLGYKVYDTITADLDSIARKANYQQRTPNGNP